MADKTLKITLKADDQLTGSFKKVGDASQEMGQAIERSTKGASEGAKALGSDIRALEKDLNTAGTSIAAVGAAGTLFFGAATNSSMGFTSAMTNVNSIARLTSDQLAALGDSVQGLSRQYGAGPTELAEGLYSIQSSGFSAAEGLDILEASVVAAGAGMTTTETSAKAIVATLNAYQMSASEAGNVSDVLFKIVDSGVITFEELANNLGNTLPLAASLSVSIEELGAAYAQLTLSGIGASQAETQIAALMRAALGPTEALTEAVQQYGYESAEALIQAEGLAGFLIFLQQASGGTSAGLLELVGTQEALNAALVLGRDDAQGYIATVEEMGGAAQDGAYTLEVFGIQMDNAAGSVRMASAELQNAAINIGSALEPLVGFGAEVVAGLVGSFNDLDPAAQGAAAALGAIGSGVAVFTGAAMLAIPKAVELYDALRRIRQGSALASAAFGPWGLVIAGVTAAVAVGASAWLAHRREVEAAQAAYASVATTALEVQDIVNNMKLSGTDLELAGQIDEINLWTAGTLEAIQTVNEQRLDWSKILQIDYAQGSDAASDQIRLFLDGSIGRGFIQWAQENDKLGAETIQILMEGSGPELVSTVAQIQPIMDEFFAMFDVPPGMHQSVSENTKTLVDYMMKPLVDSEKVMADWNAARKKYLEDPLEPDVAGYDTWLKEYVADLPDVTANAAEAAGAIDGMGTASKEAAASAEDLLAVFEKLPATIDQLRLEGEWELADQLESLHQSITDTFSSREFMGLGAPGGELNGFIDVMNLTETQLGSLDTAWQRTMQGMSSGVLDNAALMEDWNAILQDSTKTDAEKVAALELLSLSTHQYRDSNKAMHEDQLEFLKDGERILDWWREYDRIVGSANTDDAFRGLVDWAGDIGDAGRALDQALRTFRQIDDLGSRSSSADSIATNLIGEPGEWGEIDNMLNRWLENATSVEEANAAYDRYNRTVAAGTDIQESNVRVQQLLNDIRADQLPMLAEEQAAYEQNLQYLSTLNAEEQRRALMLQDSSVQAEVATAYNIAYAASIGEIPEEVATEMLINTAQADPALADLLVKMGLLNEEIGPNGEKTFSVNFPDADATVSSINRLTIAFLEMEAAARGMTGFELAIDIYGEEEAMELYGMVKNADGTYSKATVEVETRGADQVTAASDAIKEVTLADGTVVQVKTEVDTTGWEDLTAAELAAKFDNDPVKLPVEAVVQPMDGVTPEEWNAMIGPFPDITVPARIELDREAFDEDPSGYGNPSITVDATVNPASINEALDNIPATLQVVLEGDTAPLTQDILDAALNPPPIKMPVEFDYSALNGSGHQDANGLGAPVNPISPITVPIGVDTSAVDDALADLQATPDTETTVTVIGNDESASNMVAMYQAMDGVSIAQPVVHAIGDDTSAGNMVAQYQAMTDISIGEPVVYAMGDATSADGMIAAMGALTGVSIGEPVVYALGNSTSAQNMIDAMSAYDGATLATTYVDVVNRTRSIPGDYLGGIAGYANGGMVVELAENGPEILHFASGGTALVPNRGIYEVPAATYVSPNNAIAGNGYGGITIDFSGAVFHNTSRDEMNAWAREDFVPMIERSLTDRRTGMGGA